MQGQEGRYQRAQFKIPEMPPQAKGPEWFVQTGAQLGKVGQGLRRIMEACAGKTQLGGVGGREARDGGWDGGRRSGQD